MAIDFAAKVGRILRTGGPLPLTSATYVPGGASDALPPAQQALVGVLHGRGVDPSFDSGLDDELATFTVELAKFTIGDPRSPDDELIVGAEVPWQVRSVDRRQAHVTFALGRRLIRGRKLELPAALGAVAWWSANSGVSASSPVASWLDRIAGVSLAQAVVANQPTLVANVQNGKPGVRFAAAGPSFLTSSTVPFTAAPFTVFVVFKAISSHTGLLVGLFRAGSPTLDRFQMQLVNTGPVNFTIADSATVVGTNTSTIYTPVRAFLATFEERATNDHRVRLDGAGEGFVATSKIPANLDQLRVGNSETAGFDLNADLMELMFFGKQLTTSELNDLHAWISGEYAIALP